MGDWLIAQGGGRGGPATSTSPYVSSIATSSLYGPVIASSSSDFGGWTVLAGSSETGAIGGLVVHLHAPSAAARCAIQIGVGPAGSQVVLVDKLMLQAPRATESARSYVLPIAQPAAQTYSARLGASSTAISAKVALTYLHAGFAPAPLSRVRTYGLANNGAGVQVDPGATANTKGAWAFVSSSGIDFTARMLCVMLGLRANAAATSAQFRIDIATGSSSAPSVIASDLVANANTTADDVTPHFWDLPCMLASGALLLARAQTDITDATDRLLDVAIQVRG